MNFGVMFKQIFHESINAGWDPLDRVLVRYSFTVETGFEIFDEKIVLRTSR